MKEKKQKPAAFRIRSFVGRNSRKTAAQEKAYQTLWPQYGLSKTEPLAYEAAFGRLAPCYLEIGFGMGTSLLALAAARPENNYIGVETHQPGIGAILNGIKDQRITNIRLFHGDVIDVLEQCIPDHSLAGVQIFFPDPWPKRRHHERRLVQSAFVKLIATKLQPQGILHLATDWEDYAKHMLEVLSAEIAIVNTSNEFSSRSSQRPIVTKFEKRAEREKRKIWELQFVRK